LARWAIPCYAAILLTFLHLSARSDFVDRWRLQEKYSETAGERLDQIESALRAFDARNVAFFEFAAGQYADILIENCRGFLRRKPQLPNCSKAAVKWTLSSPSSSSYSMPYYRAGAYTSGDRVISGVRAVAPLLRRYVIARESELPTLIEELRTVWKSKFETDAPLSGTDPRPFADSLRTFARRQDALHKIGFWALYDVPPRELAALDVGSLGRVSRTTFDDLHPIRLKTGIEPFKSYVRHYIDTRATQPGFISGFSALHQEWLKSSIEGGRFEASAPTLPLAGIQANLRDSSRLIPLLLLSFYGLYCIVYLGWLRSPERASEA
jgi:hypothetical protein